MFLTLKYKCVMFRICNISLIHANLHKTYGGKIKKKKYRQEH